MNVKIERVNRDIQKTRDKISELGAKLRELEKQKTEIENIEIVDAVRSMNISLSDLADLLKKQKGKIATSGDRACSVLATKSNNDKEETNN